jgi:DNA-binding transcriptional ArsR family regulator
MARTTSTTERPQGGARTPERVPGRPMLRTMGAAPVTVEFDVRTIYDFMVSLSDDAGSTEDLPAVDREWLKSARGALPELARRDREGFLANEAFLGALVVAVEHPAARTSAELVEAIRTTDARALARLVMVDTTHNPELTPLVEAALAGDHTVLPRIEEAMKAKLQPEQCSLRVDLLRQPEEYHRRLVGVLEAWQVRFAEVEGRVASMIRRDADDRTVDRGTLAPIDLIERTTGGIRWIPETAVGRVILAPSYFARPYNYLFSGEGWRLFVYPLNDSALDGSDPLAPPPAMIRLHRALGDETRLRILKLLTERDLYLTEIAHELNLTKPTIKHHLALLRAAGLLTVTEEGAVIYYSLRRDRLEEATRDVGRFLTA